MNLIDALTVAQQPVDRDAPQLAVSLACGFTPLHFATYLRAWLRIQDPLHPVLCETGIFGDLLGNLQRARSAEADVAVAVIEWSDLDARLGFRSLGSWRVDDLADIVASAERQFARLVQAIGDLAAQRPCVCILPTLPLPPLFPSRTLQSSAAEMRLRRLVGEGGVALAELGRVRLLNSQALDEASPPRDRYDFRSDMMSGFPYRLAHAETLARLASELVPNPAPKKGLITDLDDTLWSGILGEVGVDKIGWDLSTHALVHGIYQQFLSSLASNGVLLGVASKNDEALASQALARSDLVVSRDCFFPVECHWSSKAESVGRILKTWNIAPDAVVFVDDSPMELAQVQAQFPDLDCRLFPRDDPEAVLLLLRNLRDGFGKSHRSEEDTLRLESIRSAGRLESLPLDRGASQDDFLREAGAVIVFATTRSDEERALELINKTNQFNLNGRRLAPAQWSRYLNDGNAFLLSAHYEDKYGRLGNIAAILARRVDHRVWVDWWVMSCRAFSRRIEHQCLKYLFEKFAADEVWLDYQATQRNGPVRDFLQQMAEPPLLAPVRLAKAHCAALFPPLFHTVRESAHE